MNNQVNWLGGPLNRLWGVIRNWSADKYQPFWTWLGLSRAKIQFLFLCVLRALAKHGASTLVPQVYSIQAGHHVSSLSQIQHYTNETLQAQLTGCLQFLFYFFFYILYFACSCDLSNKTLVTATKNKQVDHRYVSSHHLRLVYSVWSHFFFSCLPEIDCTITSWRCSPATSTGNVKASPLSVACFLSQQHTCSSRNGNPETITSSVYCNGIIDPGPFSGDDRPCKNEQERNRYRSQPPGSSELLAHAYVAIFVSMVLPLRPDHKVAYCPY